MAWKQIVSLGPVILRLQDHTQTNHTRWDSTSDQLVAETSTCQHTTLTGNKHPLPGGIRTRNPSKRLQAYTLDRATTEIGLQVT
jgi:hypothetical protein